MAGQKVKDLAPVDLQFATGTAAANGNNTLIAAPTTGRIVIVDIQIQNESSTATTAILNGISGNFWRFLGQFQGDGFARQDAYWRLDLATALVLNLSGANSHGYSVSYYISTL